MRGRMRRLIAMGLLGGGGGTGQTPLQAMLAIFAPAGDEAGIAATANNLGALTYYISYRLYDRLYWTIKMGPDMAAVGEYQRASGASIRRLCHYYHDQTTPAATFSGSWIFSNAPGSYIGDRLGYAGATGAYVEIQVPGSTWLGIRLVPFTNRGVFKVLIDGDATLADLLPTAQDLVTAETLPDTVLVANGGTLNPTDRVYDSYSTDATPVDLWCTKSLTEGTHTIRCVVTGYKNASSGGTYLNTEGLLSHGPNRGTCADTNQYFLTEQATMTGVGVWEISWNVIPTGATQQWWVGHNGSLHLTGAPAVTVDGEAFTASTTAWARTFASGSEVIVTQNANVRHQELGETNIGTLVMTHKVNKSTGAWIDYELEWLVAGVYHGAFPTMATIDKPLFDRGRAIDGATDTIGGSPGNTYHCNTDQSCLIAWDYDGYQGFLYNVNLALATNNWALNTDPDDYKLIWKVFEDAAGMFNKAYCYAIGDSLIPQSYNIGDILRSQANYRAMWFPGGAHAELNA